MILIRRTAVLLTSPMLYFPQLAAAQSVREWGTALASPNSRVSQVNCQI